TVIGSVGPAIGPVYGIRRGMTGGGVLGLVIGRHSRYPLLRDTPLAGVTPMNRRDLLRSALAAGAGLAVANRLAAIEPIARPGPALLKLSLAAYSFNKALDRRRGAKPTMTLEQFVDLAAGWGLSAVELTQYYFAETSPEYLATLKGRCTRLGLDI